MLTPSLVLAYWMRGSIGPSCRLSSRAAHAPRPGPAGRRAAGSGCPCSPPGRSGWAAPGGGCRTGAGTPAAGGPTHRWPSSPQPRPSRLRGPAAPPARRASRWRARAGARLGHGPRGHARLLGGLDYDLFVGVAEPEALRYRPAHLLATRAQGPRDADDPRRHRQLPSATAIGLRTGGAFPISPSG